MSGPSHLGEYGAPRMVDVGDKPVTERRAVAGATVRMRPDVLATLLDAGGPKGDAMITARLAGIGAAKRTADLIPLCHPIALTHVSADFTLDEAGSRVVCRTRVECNGKTGVEVEALTAVQVALLTIYDMCKAVDRGMVIESVRLLEKHGGKSGSFVAQGPQPDGHAA